jgi:S-formylglutathione hydrolase FrmB
MALAEFSFFARSIGLMSRLSALLPDAADGPFPVLYLLHGLGDDSSTWLRLTSLERYAFGLPLIIVMPETARGWYTNSASPAGRPYEDHLLKDVIPFVDRLLPSLPERRGRAIGGLSMGGYGALKAALKFPDTFCSAHSHSGALLTPLNNLTHPHRDLEPYRPEFQAIFGDSWNGGDNDLRLLAARCPHALRPALRLDCGTDDFLLDQNRQFHSLLHSLSYPHEYLEFPGDHNWSYWDTHIQEALTFHRRALGIPDLS